MKDEHIIHSLDTIEPENGAKSRMYENIKRKAEHNNISSIKQTAVRKKIRRILPLAACLCLVLLGASSLFSKKTPDAQPPLLSNSMGGINNPALANSDVSADDFQTLGILLDAPADAENIKYSLLNETIAQVQFDWKTNSYFIRASTEDGDFSGLFGEVIASEELDSKTDAVLYTVSADETDSWKVVWYNAQCCYYLCNSDGAAKESVIELALALMEVLSR